MIILKTKTEIEAMALAGRALAEVMEILANLILPGTKTSRLDIIAHQQIKARGAIPGFLGYQGFPSNLCVSINDEAIHGIPGKRVIHEGDLVSLDCGLRLNGFWADMGITRIAGKGSEKSEKLVAAGQKALTAGIAAAQIGKPLGLISNTIEKIASDEGFSVIRTFVGHGIGRDLHEDPPVPNFGRAENGPILQMGMVLAIEPMLIEGNPAVLITDDGWTVKTMDGSWCTFFEHTVAITENGPRILTRP